MGSGGGGGCNERTEKQEEERKVWILLRFQESQTVIYNFYQSYV